MKKQFFKKLIVLTLVFVMSFSSIIISASAVGTGTALTLIADKQRYGIGDTVTVDVSISNCPTMNAMGIQLAYDANVFELDAEATKWANFADAIINDFRAADNRAAIAFDVDKVLEGTIFTIVFTVKTSATLGNTTINVTPVLKYNATVLDCDFGTETLEIVTCVHNGVTNWQCDAIDHWKYCDDCGTYVVEKASHDFGDWIVDVVETDTIAGSKHRICNTCSYREDLVVPQTLKFASGQLALDSSIAVNLKVNPAYFTTYGYINPRVVFNLDGVRQVEVTEYTVDTDAKGRYVFSFSDISPQLMGRDLIATLYATYDGVEYESAPLHYGVKTYCYNMINKDTTKAQTKKMLVDLLNYGAQAQIKQKVDVDNLMNADLTDEQKALGTQEDRAYVNSQKTDYAVVDSPKAAWKSAALVLAEAVEVRLGFEPNNAEELSNLSVKIESVGKTWTFTSDDFVQHPEKPARYYIDFDGLYANQMSEVLYATIYEGETPVSNTLQYSIETFVARNYGGNDGPLIKAMLKYGDSARGL